MTALETTAAKLKIKPSWLWALIQFESAGNPAARNKITGARGLIQFMHSTAKELGYKDADDLYKKYPTFDSQLQTPVYNYLKKYAPFPTKQSLYMAVFYPAARSWPPAKLFSPLVRKQNPGIDTVQSYIDRVEKRRSTFDKAGAVTLAIIAGIVFLSLKYFK